jgi:single-stranded DNA-specific DHH superfamily exonuclease
VPNCAGAAPTPTQPEPNLAALLDLVALGTVADVVPLDRNNRILVAQGLARIRSGRMQPGIAALLSIAGREPARAARLRPRLRHRPAPECRRAPGRHVTGHRMPDHR